MTRSPLLERASDVLDARGQAYGPADIAFETIAARWSITLGRPVTPAEVVLCMIDLKLVRLTHDPGHIDSIIDVIGYAALMPEVCR